MAGWLLGRDELLKARETAQGIAPTRKILLLMDGHLNAGNTEPDGVEALTGAGLEKDGIRTSCLGFGDGYNENILAITVEQRLKLIQGFGTVVFEFNSFCWGFWHGIPFILVVVKVSYGFDSSGVLAL